jgi:hypothetical protein
MAKRSKRDLFDIRLLTLPDRMHVINNMDVDTRAPLPSMQLWEVEDGPVVIEAPSGEARIFLRGKWCGMDPWETIFHGRPMSFQMFEEKWPGLVSVDEYLSSVEAHLKKGTEEPWRQVQ